MDTGAARGSVSDKARTLLLAAAGMVFAGCHNDGLPHGGDMNVRDMASDMPMGDMAVPDMTTHVLVTYTQFVADLARVQCMQELACGRLNASNMAACIENNTVYASVDHDLEILQGREEIDELDCLNAMRASRCDGSDFGNISDACNTHLFIPHQAVGAVCLTFAECATGYCRHSVTDAGLQPGGCTGACAPFAGINQPCNGDDNMCNTTVAFCSGGRCQPLSDVGQGCSAAPLLPCKPGLYCALMGASGTCRAPTGPGGAGAACDVYQGLSTTTAPCAVGLFCKLPDASTNQGICTAKKALGVTCDVWDGYFGNPCVDGLTCYGSPSSTCQYYIAENGDCSGGKPCEDMLYCDGTNHCVKLKADGAMCTRVAFTGPPHQCIAPAYNGGDSCLLRPPDAGPSMGSCTAFKKPNDTCVPGVEDESCSTGYCSPSTNRCVLTCP